MGIDWKAIFGDNESMTVEQLESATSGMKLADLATGEYVAKGKLDDAIKAKKAIETELADLKAATDGDDGLRKQVEALTAKLELAESKVTEATSKLTSRERLDAARAKITDPKLAKLAVIEAESLMDDDTSFEDALTKVIESDPDYAPKTAEPPAPAKVGTGEPAKGAAATTDPLIAAIERGFGGPEAAATEGK